MTLRQKRHFHPNVKNSIAFTPEEVKFEKINLDDNGFLGITDDNELISVKFEDIQLPEKVYKYRSWETEEHKRVLTNSELYFAPPSSFGDHHECNLPLRYDLVTTSLRRKWLLNYSKEINPSFSKNKHKKFVDEQIKKSLYNDPEHRKQVEIEYKKKLDESLGILSLTPVGNNPEMWEVFGNNHRGICIGFNSRLLFNSDTAFAQGGPVEYYNPDNPPIIMPFYLDSKERIKSSHTNVFSLPNHWEYENEFRISKIYIENRSVNFHKEAIVEVIIGSEMPQENKEEVLEIIRNKFPNIDVYESVKNKMVNTN